MLDTKLKSNHKKRIVLAILGLAAIALTTILCFPGVTEQAEKNLERISEEEGKRQIQENLLSAVYNGCYVLYLETIKREPDWKEAKASDVFLEIAEEGDEESSMHPKYYVNEKFAEMESNFEAYRSWIDYCIQLEDGKYDKNTSQPLEQLLLGGERAESLEEDYAVCFVVTFDANGNLSIDSVYSKWMDEDAIIKEIGELNRKNEMWTELGNTALTEGWEFTLKRPRDFTVAFGIPNTLPTGENSYNYYGEQYGVKWTAYAQAGGTLLCLSMLALTGLLVWLTTSKRIWKTEVVGKEWRFRYLAEVAVLSALFVLDVSNLFVTLLWQENSLRSYESMSAMLTGGEASTVLLDISAELPQVLFVLVIWYLALLFLSPVFSLGIREYVRQYSLCYQIFPWIKVRWEHFREEVKGIDFSEKSIKTIVKIVIVNFVVLAVISCFWVFGIWLLIGYSGLLFYFLRTHYERLKWEYEILLNGVKRIAEGDLQTEIVEDIGVFEPFKGELSKVRDGFRKAVEEEIKSQRMKTELITNVSHDLKTPLTAITTYAALLKKEDITEEERRAYVETLENKALRLKILIEDLFEVSKATSNNVILTPIEVDVANLMKQVSVEHRDAFEQRGLTLRWNIPDERVVLLLDNQKTYRVFENLFVNIQKYAMSDSRVYIDIKKREKQVEIALKNISAEEMSFGAEEVTERFVRGDRARNTEGSGLGLAIAKSLVEAQGGTFHVEIDGDLFKVVIYWKC